MSLKKNPQNTLKSRINYEISGGNAPALKILFQNRITKMRFSHKNETKKQATTRAGEKNTKYVFFVVKKYPYDMVSCELEKS